MKFQASHGYRVRPYLKTNGKGKILPFKKTDSTKSSSLSLSLSLTHTHTHTHTHTQTHSHVYTSYTDILKIINVKNLKEPLHQKTV
jgi:hypothetical protein